jgi:hypothetical protein
MANYKKIVFGRGINDTVKLEMAQRMSFSFGYRWSGCAEVVEIPHNKYLVFNPNNQEITDTISPAEAKDIVWDLDQLLEKLKTPGVNCHTVVSDCGKVKAKIYNSGVEFATVSQCSLRIFVPKDFLMKVAKSDDRKGLPLVKFEYNGRVRFVKVVRCDKEYVQGFEVPAYNTTEAGTFKKYCQGRIGTEIILVEFLQDS